jgi:hypothetical protein
VERVIRIDLPPVELRRRFKLSGVEIRTSGGWRSIAAAGEDMDIRENLARLLENLLEFAERPE